MDKEYAVLYCHECDDDAWWGCCEIKNNKLVISQVFVVEDLSCDNCFSIDNCYPINRIQAGYTVRKAKVLCPSCQHERLKEVLYKSVKERRI
jgi:hypothetical protein